MNNYTYEAQNYTDFNTVEDVDISFPVIPHGTLAKVILHLKPGNYDDLSRNWTGGYATLNRDTKTVSLKCHFTIMEGPYAKQKVLGQIGLHSESGAYYAKLGRVFIKQMLDSAYGLHPDDQSDKAVQARRTPNGFADLEGLIFWGRISVEAGKDKKGNPKDFNRLEEAATPADEDYPGLPSKASGYSPPSSAPATVVKASDMSWMNHEGQK